MRFFSLSSSVLTCLAITALPTLPPRLSTSLNSMTTSTIISSEKQEASVLEQSMRTFKKGQRALRKLIADLDGNQAAISDTLAGMERAAIHALSELPPEVKAAAEAEQPLLEVGYKRMMAQLLQTILGMEEATLRGDGSALNAGYDDLGKLKQSGHETYRD